MTNRCPVCDQKFFSENMYHVHMESNHPHYVEKSKDLADELI